jgi:exodeoxyribonuclease VII small subunit
MGDGQGGLAVAKKRGIGADFEKSLQELENLVAKMEQGDLGLEESLQAFERGIQLTRTCQQALGEAEQKVQQLLQQSDDAETVPFHDEQS